MKECKKKRDRDRRSNKKCQAGARPSVAVWAGLF